MSKERIIGIVISSVISITALLGFGIVMYNSLHHNPEHIQEVKYSYIIYEIDEVKDGKLILINKMGNTMTVEDEEMFKLYKYFKGRNVFVRFQDTVYTDGFVIREFDRINALLPEQNEE